MGELSKQLQEAGIGGDFVETVAVAEGIYSKVSPIYQACSTAYSTGKEVLTYLGVLDTPEDPFKKINEKLDAIQAKLDQVLMELEKLKKEVAVAAKLISRTLFCNEVADATKAVYNTKVYLQYPNDPFIKEDFGHSRDDAQTAADHILKNEYYWKRIFLKESLYEDLWSGTFYPNVVTDEGDEEGLIWDYRLTMPGFLEAIVNRIIVLSASGQNEMLGHQTELLNYAESLCHRYNKILSAFRAIRPPDYEEMKSLIPATDDSNFYQLGTDGVRYAISPAEREVILRDWIPGGRWRLVGCLTGVVESWTGYTSLVNYPTNEISEGMTYLSLTGSFWLTAPMAGATVTISQPEDFSAFCNRFLLRHTLRTRVQYTRIYKELGLPMVLACIRHLYTMLGKTPSQDLPNYTLWSLREVFTWIPPTLQPQAMIESSISLRKIANMVGSTEPLSMRKAFFLDENLTHA